MRHPMQQNSPHQAKLEKTMQGHLNQAVQCWTAGDTVAAERHFKRAVSANPASTAALVQMGDFHFKSGNVPAAQACFARVVALEPRDAVAWRNLAVTHASTGRHADATEAFLRALELAPEYTNAYHGLALVLVAQGRHLEAIPFFQQVITRTPTDHEAFFNFGNSLMKIGELDAAEATFQVAIALKPEFTQAMCNLGQLYFSRGQTRLATTFLERARDIAPNSADTHNNLGAVYQRDGLLAKALASYRQAAALRPDLAEAHSNIGSVELAMGHLAAAAEAYRHSLRLKPDNAPVFSDLLFSMQNDSTVANDVLFAEHLGFAERFEAPLKAQWQSHANSPEPSRRLRIGYVSGDLRHHAVAFFIEPILAAHDKSQFEIFLYSNHAQFDEVSKRLASLADRWISCLHMSEDALAARIREDGVDILIDLSGHTAHNRLLAFARKPAPVQAMWIGYGATTGLEAMDYRISDRWLDPAGQSERYHTEELVRLASGNAAFRFFDDAPAVNALPALTAGAATLACLNNPRKIGPRVIALWARILAAVPNAQLMLGNASDDSVRDDLLAQFSSAGIEPSRILFQPWMPIQDYLTLHHGIDLALDPFPFNGGTTSFHSLWMGVPFVSLAGDRTLSRCGAAVLAQAGLDDWAVDSEEAYFKRVLTALSDLPALNDLRRALRPRLAADAATRPARVTRDLEEAYRGMWRRWCETQATN